uniref:PD-(D/E)XK endonuclease-like domain-containing protein n=1 Tax=candidate division WOR-3 bacterium TaxID=2052148 RepID=A0A7V5Y0B5_UNCW3
MNSNFIYLSPTKLALFQECPLCFWLAEKEKIERPRGPTATLPQSMDKLIKNYFDYYRGRGELPPEIAGKIKGKLIAQEILDDWRKNSKNSKPRYFNKEANAFLFGALDECLIVDDKYYIPVDYKTYGYNLKENSFAHYQLQLDCYTLMLEGEGLTHLNIAYLIYYIPEKIEENNLIRFKIEIREVKTNPEKAKDIFLKAIEILRNPNPPAPSPECKFCHWRKELKEKIERLYF